MTLHEIIENKLQGHNEIELMPAEIEEFKKELIPLRLDKKNPNLPVGKARINKILNDSPFEIISKRKTINKEKISVWIIRKRNYVPNKTSDMPNKVSSMPEIVSSMPNKTSIKTENVAPVSYMQKIANEYNSKPVEVPKVSFDNDLPIGSITELEPEKPAPKIYKVNDIAQNDGEWIKINLLIKQMIREKPSLCNVFFDFGNGFEMFQEGYDLLMKELNK